MSGVFRTGLWADKLTLRSSRSKDVRLLQACLSASRAESTFKRYQGPWDRFCAWCVKRRQAFLPAQPLVVAMYLAGLLAWVAAQGMTYAVIKAASAAIFQAHRLAGYETGVTAHPAVASVRECAMRVLGMASRNRKEPVSLEMCMLVVASYAGPGCTLPDLQVACFVMLAFAGFLRYSDAVRIFADEVHFFPTHMVVFIESRKNLQFREGSVIYITRGTSFACPVALLERFLHISEITRAHRPVFRCERSGTKLSMHVPLPYQHARTSILNAFSRVLGTPANKLRKVFGLHSLRSGGATCVAATGVPLHVFQHHGGWRSARSMNVYIQPTMDQRLMPTSVMKY